MARGALAIAAGALPRWPGAIAAGVVLALVFGTLAAVAWRAEGAGGVDWGAVRFTLLQAALSAAISVAAAIPVARALARRQFRGRGALITLLGAPFLLPVIVAILGLLAVFGDAGIVNRALSQLCLPATLADTDAPVCAGFSIYGLHGVVLAHVFFNLPLAVRLLLQAWLAIPAERFRLAASLGAPVGLLLERPMLRAVVPGIFLAVFLICLTSFAVALTLGGGPRATTVELAIYQALRFEADFAAAAQLAAIQFAICGVAAVLAWVVTVPPAFGAGLDRVVQRFDVRSEVVDALVIGLAAAFLLVPLAMVLARGIGGLGDVPSSVWPAAARSVAVAVASACLCAAMTLALALRGGAIAGFAGVVPLASSGLVMGTGLFLIVFPLLPPQSLALPVTALVNAAMALPFAWRALAPAVRAAEAGHGRLADSLGITGWARLRIVILPRIGRPLGFATGLAAALSMGDLGVIALFASDAQATLPLAMYRLMGAYRMDAAAGAALILVALSLALFWVFDRGGRIGGR